MSDYDVVWDNDPVVKGVEVGGGGGGNCFVSLHLLHSLLLNLMLNSTIRTCPGAAGQAGLWLGSGKQTEFWVCLSGRSEMC